MAVDDISPFIEVDNVSLHFDIGPWSKDVKTASNVGGTIEKVGRRNLLYALKNVSFRLEDGDRLGLLGHNGSGKSTLLQVLAGIYQPQEGQVIAHGNIGNALNINLGFRDEATGRQNIRLKAILAERPKSELPELIADVEGFAGLGSHLDSPMRTYSQGMRARLAFGIVTAFHYEILLLDEWLATGDARMRQKAQQRMAEFADRSSIFVLASHSDKLLSETCNKGMILDRGEVVFFGGIEEAVALNKEMMAKG